MAFFDDAADTAYVVRSLWDRMDSLSQAALVEHELFYRDLRHLKEKTSELARLTVTHVNALRGPLSIIDGLNSTSLRYMANPDFISQGGSNEVSDFYVTHISESGMDFSRVQFSHIQGHAMLAKSWIDLPTISWNLTFGRSTKNPNFVGCILQSPSVVYEFQGSVSGTMAKGLMVRVEANTGEPVKLSLLRNGQVVSEGYVDGGARCTGLQLR